MRKKSYIIVVFCFFLIAYSGYSIYNYLFPVTKPIQYPEVNTISSIDISSGGVVTRYSDISHIETISNYIVNAKATRIWSVNDTPAQQQYYCLRATAENDARIYKYYIYEESSKLYIEQPYYGVYLIDKSIGDFLDDKALMRILD